MWLELNSQSGLSDKQGALIKKPGDLPEQGESVLHPSLAKLEPTLNVKEEILWHEEKRILTLT